MPHLIIEYSANLTSDLDPQTLVDVAHDAVATAGPFALGGVRTRAIRHDEFAVADRHPDNGFIHLTLYIGTGRDDATKRATGDHILHAVKRT